MTTPPPTNLYKHHWFPAEIINHFIWLYFRFRLSHRDGGELMAARGVILGGGEQWNREPVEELGEARSSLLRC
jgi:transposase-like protein